MAWPDLELPILLAMGVLGIDDVGPGGAAPIEKIGDPLYCGLSGLHVEGSVGADKIVLHIDDDDRRIVGGQGDLLLDGDLWNGYGVGAGKLVERHRYSFGG